MGLGYRDPDLLVVHGNGAAKLAVESLKEQPALALAGLAGSLALDQVSQSVVDWLVDALDLDSATLALWMYCRSNSTWRANGSVDRPETCQVQVIPGRTSRTKRVPGVTPNAWRPAAMRSVSS